MALGDRVPSVERPEEAYVEYLDERVEWEQALPALRARESRTFTNSRASQCGPYDRGS
jgi:hypothetical protein